MSTDSLLNSTDSLLTSTDSLLTSTDFLLISTDPLLTVKFSLGHLNTAKIRLEQPKLNVGRDGRILELTTRAPLGGANNISTQFPKISQVSTFFWANCLCEIEFMP